MDRDLTARSAVVTGAGRGIGRAVAMALANAGAKVTCVARTESELASTVEAISEAGGLAQSVVCDVAAPEAPELILASAGEWSGPIDLLVNNAGVIEPIGWFVDNPVDEWLHCMDVNFNSAVRLSHAVAPGMIDRRLGHIINISSAAADFAAVPPPGVSGYFVSKTALTRFTELVGAELEPHGVYVFAIDPGGVATELVRGVVSSGVRVPATEILAGVLSGGGFPAERVGEFCVQLSSGASNALTGLHLPCGADIEALTGDADRIRETSAFTLRFTPHSTTR